MSNQTVAVTDATFEADVLASPLPVLVDVWATWCAPCRQVSPIVEQLATEYAGRLAVATVDADANTATVERMGVVSIPTLAVYRAGEVVATLVGARPKPQIVAVVEGALA